MSFWITSTRNPCDLSVVQLHDALMDLVKECVQSDDDTIDTFNRKFLNIYQLCIYVACPWDEWRYVLQYLMNLSQVFGHYKIQWQDVDHPYRSMSLLQVMEAVSTEWNKLITRRAIISHNGTYMDSQFVQLTPYLDQRYGNNSSTRSSSRRVCTTWKNTGQCTYGDNCMFYHGQDAPSTPQPTTKSLSFDDDATVHATSTFPTCSWCQKSHDQNKICSEQQRYIDKRTKALAAKEEEKSKPLFGKYPRKPQVSQIYLDTSEEDAIFDESDDSDDYSCY